MKVYFTKAISRGLGSLTDNDQAADFSEWLSAASRNGWDLASLAPASTGTTIVVFSREVPQQAGAPAPAPGASVPDGP